MSDRGSLPLRADLARWVEEAGNDPVKHRTRQVTEILLHAIGLSPVLRTALILKGGTLMSIAFGSPRSTADVDFSAAADPGELPKQLSAEFDRSLRRAAAELGYVDLICRVQSIRHQPRAAGFEECLAPALLVTIGSARRGSGEEARLERNTAPQVLAIDISFKEPLLDARELCLDDLTVSLQAYSPAEVIAEKLRALLQQAHRNRGRRQDVYDIAFLLERLEVTAELRSTVLGFLLTKCRARGFEATATGIDDPAVAARASRDWNSLALELPPGTLPEFDERFALVRVFYCSLPWPAES